MLAYINDLTHNKIFIIFSCIFILYTWICYYLISKQQYKIKLYKNEIDKQIPNYEIWRRDLIETFIPYKTQLASTQMAVPKTKESKLYLLKNHIQSITNKLIEKNYRLSEINEMYRMYEDILLDW